MMREGAVYIPAEIWQPLLQELCGLYGVRPSQVLTHTGAQPPRAIFQARATWFRELRAHPARFTWKAIAALVGMDPGHVRLSTKSPTLDLPPAPLPREPRPARDLSGKQFGFWTVIERGTRPAGVSTRNGYWLCRCVCGAMADVRHSNLIDGLSRSCGKPAHRRGK